MLGHGKVAPFRRTEWRRNRLHDMPIAMISNGDTWRISKISGVPAARYCFSDEPPLLVRNGHSRSVWWGASEKSGLKHKIRRMSGKNG
jgi:hypothetical protein